MSKPIPTEEEFKKSIQEFFYQQAAPTTQRKIVVRGGAGYEREFHEAMKREAEKLFGKIFTPEERLQQDLLEVRRMLYEDDAPTGTEEDVNAKE